MIKKYESLENRFKLIEDNINSINDEIDYTNQIIVGLVNIILGSPPDSILEKTSKENIPGVLECPESPPDKKIISNPEEFTPKNESEKQESSVKTETSNKEINQKPIKICLYKFTYIWETNGESYWTFLFNVNRYSISGFRWIDSRWGYFCLSLKRIDSFVCYSK